MWQSFLKWLGISLMVLNFVISILLDFAWTLAKWVIGIVVILALLRAAGCSGC